MIVDGISAIARIVTTIKVVTILDNVAKITFTVAAPELALLI
jgi:hypothetical protein